MHNLREWSAWSLVEVHVTSYKYDQLVHKVENALGRKASPLHVDGMKHVIVVVAVFLGFFWVDAL